MFPTYHALPWDAPNVRVVSPPQAPMSCRASSRFSSKLSSPKCINQVVRHVYHDCKISIVCVYIYINNRIMYYTCTYIYMCVCAYMHTYTYIYIHMCIYIYIYTLEAPGFRNGWGGVGHVNVMFMLHWCYVHGRGWVGWGMLTSCSCYVGATFLGGVGWGMLTSCSCYIDATFMGGVGWGGAC